MVNDFIFERAEYRYITGTSPAVRLGHMDLISRFHTAHDAEAPFGPAKEVALYTAFYADIAGRNVASVDYGTNDAAFEVDTAAPTVTQGSVPSRSDARLITSTVYDHRGRVDHIMDPMARRQRQVYDDANRTIATIENATVDGSGDWVASVTFDDGLDGGRWVATGLSTTYPDRNRITSFVYDPAPRAY